MTRVVEAWRRGAERLRSAGVDSAEAEARYLLSHVLRLSTAELVLRWHDEIDPGGIEPFDHAIDRRTRGEPFAYITGEREFFGRSFFVDARVLIPRPETEHLVSAVVDRLAQDAGAGQAAATHGIVDLCTGSGAVGISILCELPNLLGCLTDVTPEALEVAAVNARRLGVADRVTLARGDLFAALDSVPRAVPAGVVTANPPYVSDSDYQSLSPEVKSEPANALLGGTDGLAIIRRIIQSAPKYMVDGGWMFLEIGVGQARGVERLLADNRHFGEVSRYADLSGIIRVIAVRKQ